MRIRSLSPYLLAVVLAACADKEPATPTVVATPTPTPTPAPTAVPTPSIKTCDLPANDDCGRSGCCRAGGEILFEREIELAMAALEKRYPEYFNEDGSLDIEEVEYTAALATQLTEMFGICAKGGGIRQGSISRDEVAMKVDNNRSQNVDVIIGSNNTPGIIGVYVCRPASF
jgi:hypothetical protein